MQVITSCVSASSLMWPTVPTLDGPRHHHPRTPFHSCPHCHKQAKRVRERDEYTSFSMSKAHCRKCVKRPILESEYVRTRVRAIVGTRVRAIDVEMRKRRTSQAVRNGHAFYFSLSLDIISSVLESLCASE